jgi:hypothetical protein
VAFAGPIQGVTIAADGISFPPGGDTNPIEVSSANDVAQSTATALNPDPVSGGAGDSLPMAFDEPATQGPNINVDGISFPPGGDVNPIGILSAAGETQSGSDVQIIRPFLSGATYNANPSSSDLNPSQINSHYGIGSANVNGNSVDGTGTTIAIIDENIDDNLGSDIAGFDAKWGLPALNSSSTQIALSLTEGGTTYNPVHDTAGSDGTDALETALDVEFAHAVAPGAIIDVIDTPTGMQLGGVSYAASLSGVAVISMSWGGAETSSETMNDALFATPSGHAAETFVAAAGDTFGQVQYPSASPNVISVGGTQLTGGTSGSEEWWSTGGAIGSGGGVSSFESAPIYQGAIEANENSGSGAFNAFGAIHRSTPDISMFASAVSVYDSTDGGTSTPWVLHASGTSLSTPLFAGIVSLTDDGRRLYTTQAGKLDGPQVALPTMYGMYVCMVEGAISQTLDHRPGKGRVMIRSQDLAHLMLPLL